jgi:hypothetical protein
MSDLQVQENKMIEVRQGETAATAVAEQSKTLVLAHYELALRHPRDTDQSRQNLLKDCQRPRFAKEAWYNKPIGKGVTGLSIRFAEAAIRNFRNIITLTTTMYDDVEKRIVNVRVIDLEANIAYAQDVTVTKTVERKSVKQGESYIKSRLNSKNEKIYIIEATDDDILNKQNALISKAIRTQALRLMPGDILDECEEAILKTRANSIAQDPDGERRNIFDSFATIGVQAEEIKDFLGHKAETLTPKELIDLRGIFQAIRDGELSWRDVIDKKNPKGDGPKAPAQQTARQKYETAKAQIEAAGKKVEMDKEINSFIQVIAKGEKEFDDGDLEAITKVILQLLAAAVKK